MHRDIKPDNIMISPEGHMTYADFGLSFVSHDRTKPFHEIRNYTLAGTPGYFAPEFLARDMAAVGYTPSADIFSLGMVFLELLAGLSDSYWPTISEEGQVRMMKTKPLALEKLVKDECARDLLSRVSSLRFFIRIRGRLLMTWFPQMLEFNPEQRASIQELMAHPYFSGIHWDSIRDLKATRKLHSTFVFPTCTDQSRKYQTVRVQASPARATSTWT